MTNEDTLLVYNNRLVANNNGLDEILNMINELPEAGSGGATPSYTNILDNTDFSTGGWFIDSSGNLTEQVSSDIYRFNKLISVVPGETLYLSKGLCLYYNSTDTSINYNTTGDLEIVIPTGVSQAGVRTFARDFATFAPAEYIISRTPIVNDFIGDVYSTQEVNTGKVWIDGKQIYRKVFTATIPTITHDYTQYTVITIDISSINCDFVVNWEGNITERDGGVVWGLNWYNAVATASSIMHVDLRDNIIKIRENSNWISGGIITVVLEYTKASE